MTDTDRASAPSEPRVITAPVVIDRSALAETLTSLAAAEAPVVEAHEPGIVTTAILEGRASLLLFRIAGPRDVAAEALTPDARAGFAEAQRLDQHLWHAAVGDWRGALIGLAPLLVLLAGALAAPVGTTPGLITWIWCTCLCGINLIYLLIGPRLWNALITAAYAIDDLTMSDADKIAIATWVRTRYWPMSRQITSVVVGAVVGMALLAFIDLASGFAFTLGPGEYTAMAVTAGLSVNGLWILWWIAGLIPELGRQPTLVLHWTNPARTPAIMFLNRALWKVAIAIAAGMALLAGAVWGQPSPFSGGEIPSAWIVAVVVEVIAFLIVGAVFVRDGIWGQWQILRIVGASIRRGQMRVGVKLVDLGNYYSDPQGKEGAVQYYVELDRHFDSLRWVDLNLGWLLAWSTSIAGALASVIFSAFALTGR